MVTFCSCDTMQFVNMIAVIILIIRIVMIIINVINDNDISN